MESIPRTLSENAGLDQVDILVALRAAHETKGLWSGINVYTGEITDMMKEGVLEPVKVKEHAIGSAVEVASMILRIDDVIAAARPPPLPGGQGPPPDEIFSRKGLTETPVLRDGLLAAATRRAWQVA